MNSSCSLNSALIRYNQGTGVFQPFMTLFLKICDVSFLDIPWIRTAVFLSCPGGHMIAEEWSGVDYPEVLFKSL